MGFFDNIFGDLSDPVRAAQVRGGLIGAGQAISQPYGNIGTGLVGAATGAQAGQDRYVQQQAQRLGLADSQLGLQQKLGQANFLRQIQGQVPLTLADVMKGNFGGTTPSAAPAIASAPQAPLQAIPQTPVGAPPQAAQNPFDVGNFYKQFIAPHEGGYTASDGNGAPANFGINQKANPDINVSQLTPDSAQQILTDRYFKPSGATSMQGPMAAIQADTAMNMGKGAASQLLAQSGGDPQKYLDLREQRYRAIAANDPTKAASLPGWLKRNSDLRQYVAQNQPQEAASPAPASQATQQSPAAQPSNGIIPPDLMKNPLFMAAVQSGDAPTVMKMITSHKTQLTQQELAANQLGSDTIAYHDPDGGINIVHASQLKPQAVLDQEAAQHQREQLKSPEAIAQELELDKNKASNKTQAQIDAIGGPDALATLAKPIAEYRAPANATGRSPVLNNLIMQEVLRQNPDYRAQNYASSNKAQQAFATGTQGNTLRSVNVAISHMAILDDLAKAMNNGNVQLLNQVKNRWAQEFGSPLPTNFDAAKGIVGDEVVKAVIGSGGGALADRENAQNQYSNAKSPQQILQVNATNRRLLAGQLEGLKKQYQDTTFLKDFDQRLTPEAKAALETVGGGVKTGGAPAQTFKASDLPANAKMQLKANVVTTFKNGSKWTLQNGKPVQVP